MLTKEEVKNNLRIDYDSDDNYIEMLINASALFIVGAIELDTAPINEPRFDTCQFMLVSLWYENRVPATSALQQDVPFTILSLIWQLRGLRNGDSNPTP